MPRRRTTERNLTHAVVHVVARGRIASSGTGHRASQLDEVLQYTTCRLEALARTRSPDNTLRCSSSSRHAAPRSSGSAGLSYVEEPRCAQSPSFVRHERKHRGRKRISHHRANRRAAAPFVNGKGKRVRHDKGAAVERRPEPKSHMAIPKGVQWEGFYRLRLDERGKVRDDDDGSCLRHPPARSSPAHGRGGRGVICTKVRMCQEEPARACQCEMRAMRVKRNASKSERTCTLEPR